jgi:type 2 lantibiotic biosynthesis protein LanM
LLCIWDFLGGNDGHFQNLISVGDQPVIFDIETLLAPRPKQLGQLANSSNYNLFQKSVVATGLLPSYPKNAALDDDLSAFSVLSPTNQTLTQWIDVNSDKMRRGQRHLVAQGGDHVVKLGEEVQWACDHEAALCAGYSAIYGIISQNRHALLQEASLNTLACQSMRFIFRNSSLYAKLHQRIQSPVCMMDGVYVSFELEKLARAFLSHDSCPNEWPIFAFERLGMMRGDIPDFHSSPRSSDLWFDSQMVVEAYFDQPAFDYAAERIRAASDTDKAQQLRFISLSLRTQAFVRQKMQYSHNRVLLTGATGKMESSQVSMDERLMRALEIGDLITHLALTQADGSVSWLGVVPDEARQAAQFAEVDDGLYEGRIGIALFLAALTAISGRAHYADLVVDRVVPSLQDRLHSSSNGGSSPQPIEIGLANGKAGIAYGLLTIATLTQRPDLLKYAVEWGQSIDSASISQTSSSDMLLGQAGVITTLLLLHEKTGHETLLKAAVHGGEQLLAQQVMTAAGMLGWPDAQGQCLTGFSHGAAGIVYALLCLADTSGDPRFFAAAGEGLAYESSLYAAAYGNWPDLRGGTLSYDGNDAWCHGAPGIGLGRLYSLPYYDSAQVRLDIARSAEFLRAQPLGRIDHLCCGNWGRLDIAHTLARALPELGLADAVQAQTQALLARSAGIGNHRISADFAPIYRLGLFQGLAGIGYALLRLLQPELPCILAFQ